MKIQTYLQQIYINKTKLRPNNKADLKIHQKTFKINYISKNNCKQKYKTNIITHTSHRDFLIPMMFFATQTFIKQVIKLQWLQLNNLIISWEIQDLNFQINMILGTQDWIPKDLNLTLRQTMFTSPKI